MDPTNNPTPTPTPEPGAAPAPEPPVPPIPEPGAAPAPEPVNPVINPGAGSAPVNPVFQPGESDGLAATDPIMQPEAPKEPDPVEEELKAPMKAAGPVPGSIGSAVSGPQSEAEEAPLPADNPFADSGAPAKTPSVSFNDPATEQGGANAPAGKKNNKTVMIILCVVLALIIIGLGVFLFFQLTGSSNSNSSSSNNNNGGNSEVVIDDGGDEDGNGSEGGNGGGSSTPVSSESGTLTCTQEIAAGEVVKGDESSTGLTTVTVEFEDKYLSTISLVRTASGDEEKEVEKYEATASELDDDSALVYGLTAKDSNGDLDLSIDAVKANDEKLDLVCEVW